MELPAGIGPSSRDFGIILTINFLIYIVIHYR